MRDERFPDGTAIDPWFYDTEVPELATLGRQYILTEHGVLPDGRPHTGELQALIDLAAGEGGGVIVVPSGVFHTGAIWLKQGVHLYISAGGVLFGSDDIFDYPVRETRIEGETCQYYPALVNAEGIDGLCIMGGGTIDGNGFRAWKAFWQRRQWNPECTNKDEQRPRLIYLSDCRNVTVAGLNLQNSHFWTNHLYRCDHVRYLGCRITSMKTPVKAPSTDAIDIDVCTDILIKDCYMEVNDDAVVMKGGKGPTADELPENGSNERILIEDCTFGFCHGCLTLGSESLHDRNILMRRIKVGSGYNFLWFKLRPDTPQHYEYVTIEDAEGTVDNFLTIRPWTQFFDLKGHDPFPPSVVGHISMRRCRFRSKTCFQYHPHEDQYRIEELELTDLDIHTENEGPHIPGAREENVRIEVEQQ